MNPINSASFVSVLSDGSGLILSTILESSSKSFSTYLIEL